MITERYMAKTAEEAEQIKTQFLNRYPPEGYDTIVTHYPNDKLPEPYKYTIVLERAASCD